MLSYDVRRGLAQVVAVREVSERRPRGSVCGGVPMVVDCITAYGQSHRL